MINHSKYCAACVVCDGIYHLVGTPCGEGLTMIQRLQNENPGLSKSQRKNRKKRDAAKVTDPFKTKFVPPQPKPENVGLTKSQRKNRKRRQ